MEPSNPHENDKRDLYEALALAERLEACEIKDKRGNVTGYIIEEGLDTKDMMRAIVILAQVYRDRLNIPQCCKVMRIETEVVSTPVPVTVSPQVDESIESPIQKQDELVHTRLRGTLNALGSAGHQGKIPSILF